LTSSSTFVTTYSAPSLPRTRRLSRRSIAEEEEEEEAEADDATVDAHRDDVA
jgi:hypothetical protein